MENQFFNENIDIKENICRYIDEWLKESKEYNNNTFGSALGLSHSSVIRWRNRVCAPDIALIPKLCKIMNVSITTLFGIEQTTQLTLTEANLIKTYQPNPDFKEFIDKYLSDEEFRSAINSIAKLSR